MMMVILSWVEVSNMVVFSLGYIPWFRRFGFGVAQLEWEGRLFYFSYEERILNFMNISHSTGRA